MRGERTVDRVEGARRLLVGAVAAEVAGLAARVARAVAAAAAALLGGGAVTGDMSRFAAERRVKWREEGGVEGGGWRGDG